MTVELEQLQKLRKKSAQVRKPAEEFSEISKNKLWEEAIKRELQSLDRFKGKYACNVHLLQKSAISPKPTALREQNHNMTAFENSKSIVYSS